MIENAKEEQWQKETLEQGINDGIASLERGAGVNGPAFMQALKERNRQRSGQ